MISQNKEVDYFAETDYMKNHCSAGSCSVSGVHNEKAKMAYLVPTYHRTEFLAECLNSILVQEARFAFEVIVVDNEPGDSSPDSHARKIVESFGDDRILFFVNNTNLGPMGNWNQCLKFARTEWICMVHDDDVIPADHLSTMQHALSAAPDADCIACNCMYVDMRHDSKLNLPEIVNSKFSSSSCSAKVKYKKASYHLYGFRTPLLGALIRRECALKIGGFGDPPRVIFEDYIFMTKLLIECKVYKVGAKAYGYRIQQNDSLNLEMWEQEQIDEYFFKQQLANRCNANPVQKFMIKARTIMRVLDANCARTSSFGLSLGIDMGRVLRECEISVLYYPFGVAGHVLKKIRNTLLMFN